MQPRWKKILKDFTSNKLRTLLVVFTIWAGVVAVGWVATSFQLILTDMDRDYQTSNPHAAIIFTDPFNDDLLVSLAKVPGVGDIDGRAGTSVTYVRGAGEEYPLQIVAVPKSGEMKVDRILPVGSKALPQLKDHEILVEHSIVSALPLKVGDILHVELDSKRTRDLKIVGFVHDVNSPPFVFTRSVSGYVSQPTLSWLEGPDLMNQIYMTVLTDKRNETHIKNVADGISKKVEDSGRTVYFTFIFSPGRHYASDITTSLGVIMGIMGVLVVLLGAFLVINIIYSIIGQQIRQIGVMKAIGARRMQLVGMYLVLVLIFGMCALIMAIPVSSYFSYPDLRGIAQYLNFNIGGMRIPRQTVVLQVVVALLIPVLAAFYPVIRGTKITISRGDI